MMSALVNIVNYGAKFKDTEEKWLCSWLLHLAQHAPDDIESVASVRLTLHTEGSAGFALPCSSMGGRLSILMRWNSI